MDADLTLRMTPELKRNLARLSRLDLRSVVMVGGERLAGEAARRAPVRTGLLRNSYTGSNSGGADGSSEQVAEVSERGGVIVEQVGTNVEYAPEVEYLRKPHFRPALAESRDEVFEDMRLAAAHLIERL